MAISGITIIKRRHFWEHHWLDHGFHVNFPMVSMFMLYPLVNWLKWLWKTDENGPCIVDLPTKKGIFFHSYVSLPEAIWRFPQIGAPPNHPLSWDFPLKTYHLGIPPCMETAIWYTLHYFTPSKKRPKFPAEHRKSVYAQAVLRGIEHIYSVPGFPKCGMRSALPGLVNIQKAIENDHRNSS